MLGLFITGLAFFGDMMLEFQVPLFLFPCRAPTSQTNAIGPCRTELGLEDQSL